MVSGFPSSLRSTQRGHFPSPCQSSQFLHLKGSPLYEICHSWLSLPSSLVSQLQTIDVLVADIYQHLSLTGGSSPCACASSLARGRQLLALGGAYRKKALGTSVISPSHVRFMEAQTALPRFRFSFSGMTTFFPSFSTVSLKLERKAPASLERAVTLKTPRFRSFVSWTPGTSLDCWVNHFTTCGTVIPH